MMNLSLLLPTAASVTDLLNHVGTTVSKWGNSGAIIFGVVCLVVGMIALGQAIFDLRKHQPSGIHWLVAILGLVIGGYFLKGIGSFEQIATTTGQSSVNSALNGQG